MTNVCVILLPPPRRSSGRTIVLEVSTGRGNPPHSLSRLSNAEKHQPRYCRWSVRATVQRMQHHLHLPKTDLPTLTRNNSTTITLTKKALMLVNI